MNLIPILLSSGGFFNLVPNVLPYSDSNIKNLKLRSDKYLIQQFNQYQNLIAKNCILRVEHIPFHIFKEKKVVIYTSPINGYEELGFFETDGDVYMRDF
jgi:hypothetical protein